MRTLLVLAALLDLPAWAGDAVALDPPVPVGGTPLPAVASAYLLPPQDPAWLTDDRPLRTCVVGVSLTPGQALEVVPGDCPPEMAEDIAAATRQWAFDSEGPTRLQLAWVLRYSEQVQTMTLHVEADPGRDLALEGAAGVPGLMLAHPAEPARPIATRLPRAAKKAGISTATCRLRARVLAGGQVAEVAVVDCPDALVEDATRRVERARWNPRLVDGLGQESVAEVSLAYGR